ncbi:hypothetical protein HSX44_00755 [Wolbachia endosymbiont of Onchocerca gibsoni]|uniref:hypothetical protein n=1 Tax=Wolbachia endosymbiont of Onchocerca gibsoni TaxID=118986 RepID=UPI0023D86D75|nr:hypothetical protein [Wolbachia endosymbiont of Onchocerca gibsoni]MDF0607440.1 hypothetical protein [Wolbachia endosymbiont of Onchocerca gibsoni]
MLEGIANFAYPLQALYNDTIDLIIVSKNYPAITRCSKILFTDFIILNQLKKVSKLATM